MLLVVQIIFKGTGYKNRMRKSPIPSIIYEETRVVTVKFYHPKSDDYLNYAPTCLNRTGIEITLVERWTVPIALNAMDNSRRTRKKAEVRINIDAVPLFILTEYAEIIRWTERIICQTSDEG